MTIKYIVSYTSYENKNIAKHLGAIWCDIGVKKFRWVFPYHVYINNIDNILSNKSLVKTVLGRREDYIIVSVFDKIDGTCTNERIKTDFDFNNIDGKKFLTVGKVARIKRETARRKFEELIL